MNWYLKAMHKYRDFDGRAQRAEYWMFVVISTLMMVAGGAVVGMGGATESRPLVLVGVVLLMGIGLFHLIPAIAVTVRRLHDTGRSAWWLLWNFVPSIGGLILLIVTCFDSEISRNAYGDNPKSSSRERLPPQMA